MIRGVLVEIVFDCQIVFYCIEIILVNVKGMNGCVTIYMSFIISFICSDSLANGTIDYSEFFLDPSTVSNVIEVEFVCNFISHILQCNLSLFVD